MRLGKRELAILQAALAHYVATATLAKGESANCVKLVAKLSKEAEPPSVAGAVGVRAGPIHDALVAASSGKVPSMEDAGPAWWARTSRRLAGVGATEEKAKLLGLWLSNQHWMQGSTGWSTVLAKWEDWIARATAEFGNNPSGEGSSNGQGTKAGRRKESW